MYFWLSLKKGNSWKSSRVWLHLTRGWFWWSAWNSCFRSPPLKTWISASVILISRVQVSSCSRDATARAKITGNRLFQFLVFPSSSPRPHNTSTFFRSRLFTISSKASHFLRLESRRNIFRSGRQMASGIQGSLRRFQNHSILHQWEDYGNEGEKHRATRVCPRFFGFLAGYKIDTTIQSFQDFYPILEFFPYFWSKGAPLAFEDNPNIWGFEDSFFWFQ